MVAIADGVNLRDLWEELARTRGDSEFLVFEDPDTGVVETFTYAEFWANTQRVANMLWTRGVRPGDRVVVHLCNSIEFLECLFALASIGAIIVPLNAAYTPAEIAFVLRTCQVRTAVAASDLLPIGLQADYTVDEVIVVGTVDGFPSYHELRDAEPATLQHRPSIASLDPVEIMFTSGTTARPKGVTLTHHNLIFSGHYVNWELAMNSQDRYLTTMAATHVNLQLSALMPVLTAGCVLILEKRYSASRLWRQVRTHRATLLQSMAMMVRTLLAQPVEASERDHELREVHYFLPITDAEKQDFETRFGVRLSNNYGSTESLVGCITDPPHGPRRWPSIGRVGLGYQARIVDETGRDVPAGQTGEIWIKGEPGRTLMAGYWCDQAATDQVLHPDGWFRTSDYGYVDEQGWFYFLDRKVDLIKRAGENVSTVEVEDVLLGFPGIRQAAVVGIPDSVRDEAVKAFIVPDPGVQLDIDALIKHCEAHLSYFKVPTAVEITADLPRGNYGKVQKKLLVNTRKDENGYQH